jgi:HlyD family secretion protein/epimerase transport system membrane fusion protein
MVPTSLNATALDTPKPIQGRPGKSVPTSPWPVIAMGVATIVLFFVVLGGWAATAPLASAVQASGNLIVSGDNKVVQHLDGGIIREILVKNGDKVIEGQVLLRVDDVQAKASVDLIRSQYFSLRALEARLQAERDNTKTISFSQELLNASVQSGVQAMIEGQNNLFTERRRTLDGQVLVLRQRIKQLKQQIGGAAIQQQAQDEQLKLIQDELSSAMQLYVKGYVPRTRILELQRAAAALSGESGAYKSSKASTQQAIGEAELQILQLQKERLSEVTQSLSDTQDKINAMTERLHAAEDVLKRTVIVAPASGTVLNLAANTIGGVIGPGGKILEIVPGDRPLLIRAAVRPEDIAEIRPGLATEIRLTAYNQRSTGVIHGSVTEVSADRIVTPQDPRGHFEIKAQITDDLSHLPEIDIVPGMPAILSIPIQERSVLQYIVGPLTDYISSGMREK